MGISLEVYECSAPGALNYTCPSLNIVPQCNFFDAAKDVEADCYVVSYTTDSTTCTCSNMKKSTFAFSDGNSDLSSSSRTNLTPTPGQNRRELLLLLLGQGVADHYADA